MKSKAKGNVLEKKALILVIKRLLEHVRHAYDCQELKYGGECTCGFHEAVKMGTNAMTENGRKS